LHNGNPTVEAKISTAVSRNPYFTFELANAQLGDLIQVKWMDNLGLHDEEELRIQENES